MWYLQHASGEAISCKMDSGSLETKISSEAKTVGVEGVYTSQRNIMMINPQEYLKNQIILLCLR